MLMVGLQLDSNTPTNDNICVVDLTKTPPQITKENHNTDGATVSSSEFPYDSSTDSITMITNVGSSLTFARNSGISYINKMKAYGCNFTTN